MTGEIPDALAKLEGLEELDLGNNKFTGACNTLHECGTFFLREKPEFDVVIVVMLATSRPIYPVPSAVRAYPTHDAVDSHGFRLTYLLLQIAECARTDCSFCF